MTGVGEHRPGTVDLEFYGRVLTEDGVAGDAGFWASGLSRGTERVHGVGVDTASSRATTRRSCPSRRWTASG